MHVFVKKSGRLPNGGDVGRHQTTRRTCRRREIDQVSHCSMTCLVLLTVFFCDQQVRYVNPPLQQRIYTMKLFLLIASLGFAVGQNPANSPEEIAKRFPGIDPELIVNPPEGLDLEGCFDDLMTSDLDGSGAIEKDEYLHFINVYGVRICYDQDELTLEQHGAFNSLACMCEAQEGNDASCCLLDNAKLPTANARTPELRTNEELLWMTVTCVVTDGLLEHRCTAYPLTRDEADPLIFDRNPWIIVTDVQEDGTIWAIVMGLIGLLLLVCLCCCCCAAGTKSKIIEEEEDDEDVQFIPPAMKEAPAEQAPRELDLEQQTNLVPPPPPPPAQEEEEIIEEEEQEELPPGDQVEITEEIEEVEEGVGAPVMGANAMSDEDEGEGRRKRGSNYVDEEDDDGIPRWGAPRLPPPENPPPPPLILKPIPDKEPEEPPEWDQPGREILEPKHKDEMEGQTFEPYIPDGGVARDDRQPKDPVKWKSEWNRSKPPEEDEEDKRKHRIQSGLDKGEIWDKLDEADVQSQSIMTGGGDVFDWVVQSALGVLDKADDGQDESETQASGAAGGDRFV